MSQSKPLLEFPLAYLITFHTYGTWLHGDGKGSVDRLNNRPETDFVLANQQRKAAMQQKMTGEVIVLNETQRPCVEQAITGVCEYRDWELLAINIRTNHVHVVVVAAVKPEKVMSDFKSWATRKLREIDLVDGDQKVWSRHGSTRYLWDQRAVESACRYVMEGQGVDL